MTALHYPTGELKTVYIRTDTGFTITGEYVSFYKSGIVNFHGMYLNSQPHGECKAYDEFGKLMYRRYYDHGHPMTEKVLPYIDNLVMLKLSGVDLLPIMDPLTYIQKFQNRSNEPDDA